MVVGGREHTLKHERRAERHDQRTGTQPCDEQAVTETHEDADRGGREDPGQDHRRLSRHDVGRDHGREADEVRDRQVDGSDEERQRLAERHETERYGALQKPHDAGQRQLFDLTGRQCRRGIDQDRGTDEQRRQESVRRPALPWPNGDREGAQWSDAADVSPCRSAFARIASSDVLGAVRRRCDRRPLPGCDR